MHRKLVVNLDEEIRNKTFREKLKKQNNGENIAVSKYRPKYPDSAEREYIKLVNEYMALEKQVIVKYLPDLKRIINQAGVSFNADSNKDNDKKRRMFRFKDISRIFPWIQDLFDSIRKELETMFGLFNLKKRLNNIANINRKLIIREWKKAVGKTFGINLLDDYYSGGFYDEAIAKWVADNVELITTVHGNSLDKMKELVYDHYMQGKTTTDIVKAIQRQYGMDKRHARLIARDQTAKLNSNITQHQQRDAGVRRYKWSSSRDKRVRDSHKALDGNIFDWNSPPETDKGRRCHPGEDFQCRCCAIPVFEIDHLNLPA